MGGIGKRGTSKTDVSATGGLRASNHADADGGRKGQKEGSFDCLSASKENSVLLWLVACLPACLATRPVARRALLSWGLRCVLMKLW